ncbi:hypothetical protein NP233_g7681 [Leucocoprinus birnbaumii]|uniref:XPG-I domain-containing protein n=1 Tax=Leucocoprinus birnbaumii TaxID=56174 RepID=A0AAD5VPJ7_9AGAR|nr:hypothetical protein NP233_g7681 [Leucocoprinus birnbaumii]
MGVAGLWDVLKPAAKTRSLTELAVTEGFQANPRGLRGYRVGIDASIWFFHAEYGKEGENPVLRTLFFRCATLMKAPFLPLFVFDGPKRPDFKRGKRINKTGNKLIPGMKRIVEAFGFEWRTAPGEAEAELAYLNRIGVIDGILSDDVDNFLFGAMTVIRNQSNNLSGNKSNPVLNSEGKDDKNHTRVFRFQDIHDHSDIQLTRGGFILIGLMSGGDYEGGLERCGIATAHALARCGFGDTLVEAARTRDREQLVDFLDNWREELRHELRTNSRGFLARKALSLSKTLPDTFPNIDVLLSYVNPVTSESLGHDGANPKITWSKEPNVAALASACELFFEWGYEEAIVKRFRTVIWPGAVLRILRRAVLDVDGHSTLATTPHKPGHTTFDSEDGYGTPSKMIAKHFAAINLDSDDEADSEQREDSRLIVSISRERTHASTDGLPEYRLEVAPAQLVNIAVSGLQGLRQPEGPNKWASDEDDEDDGGDEEGPRKRGKAKEPVDPMSHFRLWMPVCMVDPVEKGLVRNFRETQERKKQKKKVPARKKKQQEGATEISPVRRNRGATRKKREEPIEELSAPPSPIQAQSSSTATSPLSRSTTIERLTPCTPSKRTPEPSPLNLALRKEEEEESSEDEGELPIIPIPAPKVKDKLTAPVLPKKSTKPTTTSKASQVAAMFDTSKLPVTSSRAIDMMLQLSDSDDELPMHIYQSIRPKKPLQPTTSNNIPGYLSLSDDEDNFRHAISSPVKRKKPASKTQTQATSSAFVGRGSRKEGSENREARPSNPPLHKSPRKSKSHLSPRSSGKETEIRRGNKANISVLELSDDSDEGYSGVSRPTLPPLQLARNRVKGGSASARPKHSSILAGDIIDLT